MKTAAVVFVRESQVELQDIEMPPPAPGEVQIRTEHSCVSVGTEGWILRDQFVWTKTPFPCVPGYQRVGVVTEIGAQVEGWRVGERAMAIAGSWPGATAPFWGSHLALANSLAEHVFHLPEGVDDIDASCGVVAQVGFNAASRAALQSGDWVVVYGDGLIGQSAAQSARARGARVVLVGHRDERLKLAATHSADAIINSHREDVEARVLELTDGQKVAVVLDSVQTEAAQREYLPLLENGRGQIVYCGFTPRATWADMGLLQQHELSAHFVAGWNRERMEKTFNLMADEKLRVRPLITHHVAFERAPQMYRMMLEKSEPFLGIALDWRTSE